MEKLKLGIFIDAFYPMIDGVISVVDNLAKKLSSEFDVTVFTVKPTRKKRDEIEHPYKVVRCKATSVFFLDYDLAHPSLDREFNKILKDSKLDVVYFHSPSYLAKVACKYAKKNNIPVICHLHSQYKRDIYRATHNKVLTNLILKLFMQNFNKADLAIAVNEFTRDLYLKEYNLKVPVKVVYNATYMKPVEDKIKARQIVNEKFKLNDQEKVLLYVGRINKLKDIDLILDCLPCIEEKFKEYKLILVGNGNDEEYFKKKARNLKLENKIIFAGKIMDKELLANIYCRADLFLFPSHYDTDGIVKLEAASQNTPTVYVENTGACSSIIDNVTGFISKFTPKDYAEKILYALTNENIYKKVSENVRTMLYRTWDDSANEIKNIIYDMVKGVKNE